MESEGLDISAAASYSGFGVTASASSQSDTEKKQAESFKHHSSEQLVYSFGASPPADIKVSTWLDSVKTNPVPISIKLQQLDTLFEDSRYGQVISEKLGSTQIKNDVQQDLKQFIDSYCKRLHDEGKVASCSIPDPDPPFPSVGLRALYRFYKKGDHMASTSSNCEGYTMESKLGCVADGAMPGTKQLYRCKFGSDHFTTTDVNCENTGSTGQSLGWIWTSPQESATLQLHRCRKGGDHFDSLDSECEGRQVEDPLGYLSDCSRPPSPPSVQDKMPDIGSLRSLV